MKKLLNSVPPCSGSDQTTWSRTVIGGLVSELTGAIIPDVPRTEIAGIIRSNWNLLADAADDFARWVRKIDVPAKITTAVVGAAAEILPEEIGEIYQYLRRPVARAVSIAALKESEKISGEDILAVTQFLTDDYMVSWLTSMTLGSLDGTENNPVIVDPAVGGGAFLISAHRFLVGQVKDPEQRQALSQILLSDGLRGYDLDPFMAQIAAFGLWLEASRTNGAPVPAPTRILTGGHSIGGALDRATLTSITGEPGQRRIVFLTNPPFLARRLMGSDLKSYLETNYPMVGNDLCAAFMQLITDSMRPGDLAGIVHQSTIRHLISLQTIAAYVAGRHEFIASADVGTKAFQGVSGEKVRTTLSIVRKKAPGLCSNDAVWPEPTVDLSRLNRRKKEELLRYIRLDTPLPTEALPLEQEFRMICNRHSPTVSRIARPMQGSSTGDNSRFVKFTWEVHADDPDWRQASKGGGYSRWAGLRRYVVYWGESGAKLREFRGSALRNPQYAEDADIVWSDTSSFGLSARIQAKGDIFMASGPGISVGKGSKWALAAILNSRVATTWLRFDNPKLTITPGAIGAIPIPDDSWDDPQLDKLGRIAHGYKTAMESYYPDSLYWTPASIQTDVDVSAPENMRQAFLNLLKLELGKLEAEFLVETRVRELLGSPSEMRKITDAVAGRVAWDLPPRKIRQSELDQQLLLIPLNLRPAARSYRGTGVDGLLESMSLNLGAHPLSVYSQMSNHAAIFQHMERLSIFLIHHAVLGFIGYTGDRKWDSNRRELNEVDHHLNSRFGARDTEVLRPRALLGVHRRMFHGRSVLSIENENLVLKRSER